MQVSVETTQGLERKMTVAVPREQVDTAVTARLQQTARSIRLNGFRKGKVPFKVIKSKFGKEVRMEVINELMNQTYFEALNQENLKPAGQPQIEPNRLEDESADLEFTATFEVYPEVELPDFSKVAVERVVADVTDSDIDEMIETLRTQRQSWEVADRPAADGDMVNIDYVGKKDGEEFAGGKAEGSSVVLGSERMISGFEAGMQGKVAGDEFTLPLSFPEEYHNADLAGQEVEFGIKINSVNEQVLPELNEEFYASFGVDEGGEEAFRTEVASNMKRELKTATRNKLKNAIMDALVEKVDFTIPQSLIAAEVQQLRQQALQQMGGGQNIDSSMLPDELFAEQARRRVVLGLVLGEIIQIEAIKVDAAQVRERIEELASTYESPEEVVNWYYGNKDQLESIESGVLEDQVFDFIIERATISEKSVPYQEAIAPEPRKDSTPEQTADDSEGGA